MLVFEDCFCDEDAEEEGSNNDMEVGTEFDEDEDDETVEVFEAISCAWALAIMASIIMSIGSVVAVVTADEDVDDGGCCCCCCCCCDG